MSTGRMLNRKGTLCQRLCPPGQHQQFHAAARSSKALPLGMYGLAVYHCVGRTHEPVRQEHKKGLRNGLLCATRIQAAGRRP